MYDERSIKRFWKHVVINSDGCWDWKGSHTLPGGKGYGVFYFAGPNGPTTTSAQRASWLIHFGAIADGLFVLHRCDCPPCTRPDHLFLGTPKQNTADMYAKGRNRTRPLPGESNPAATTTAETILRIRPLKESGHTSRQIATALGISQYVVENYLRGKTWRHLV